VSGSVVCGVDGSAVSDAALDVASGLARRLGLRLVVVHAAEPARAPDAVSAPYAVSAPFGGLAGRVAVAEERDTSLQAAEELVEEVVDAAGLHDVEPRVCAGQPAECLADLADEEGAELIVVGSRGRGAFKSAFLGSVSNALLGVARCPVLIVPPAATGRW
jgi:nucleotide-binding universal stress UspA family protein